MKKIIALSEVDRRAIAAMLRRDIAEQAIDPNPRPPRRHSWAAKLYVAKVPTGQTLCSGTSLFPGVRRCWMYRLKEFKDTTAPSTQCPDASTPIAEYVQILKNKDEENPDPWMPRVFNVSGINLTSANGFFPVHKTETGHWLATPVVNTTSESDTLERFVMRSDWVGGLAAATFTNLSEPTWPDENGVVEDPLGIFADILGVGGQGLSIRTRYGRHYVIQAKCDQVDVPPVDPVGSCEFYVEGVGSQCVVTTSAMCTLLGGTYGGNGTACP